MDKDFQKAILDLVKPLETERGFIIVGVATPDIKHSYKMLKVDISSIEIVGLLEEVKYDELVSLKRDVNVQESSDK